MILKPLDDTVGGQTMTLQALTLKGKGEIADLKPPVLAKTRPEGR
jgi:hypothetical protein